MGGGVKATAVALLFLAALLAQAAYGKTIVVPDQYPTIQAAIDAAAPGDTVYVKSGTYRENIVVNKPIALVGENPATTTIDGGKAGTVITIRSNNVSITGFTIQNSGGWPNAGIKIENAKNCNITKNNIINNGVEPWYSNNNIISGNYIANNDVGIYLKYSSNNTIYHNNFVNNVDFIMVLTISTVLLGYLGLIPEAEKLLKVRIGSNFNLLFTWIFFVVIYLLSFILSIYIVYGYLPVSFSGLLGMVGSMNVADDFTIIILPIVISTVLGGIMIYFVNNQQIKPSTSLLLAGYLSVAPILDFIYGIGLIIVVSVFTPIFQSISTVFIGYGTLVFAVLMIILALYVAYKGPTNTVSGFYGFIAKILLYIGLPLFIVGIIASITLVGMIIGVPLLVVGMILLIYALVFYIISLIVRALGIVGLMGIALIILGLISATALGPLISSMKNLQSMISTYSIGSFTSAIQSIIQSVLGALEFISSVSYIVVVLGLISLILGLSIFRPKAEGKTTRSYASALGIGVAGITPMIIDYSIKYSVGSFIQSLGLPPILMSMLNTTVSYMAGSISSIFEEWVAAYIISVIAYFISLYLIRFVNGIKRLLKPKRLETGITRPTTPPPARSRPINENRARVSKGVNKSKELGVKPLEQKDMRVTGTRVYGIEEIQGNVPIAFLKLPSGGYLRVRSGQEIGRRDFMPYFPRDIVQYISLRHFRVYYEGGRWFVEDLGSTNGVLVNGREIKGIGPVPIRDGDIISPAGVITLTFKITTNNHIFGSC